MLVGCSGMSSLEVGAVPAVAVGVRVLLIVGVIFLHGCWLFRVWISRRIG